MGYIPISLAYGDIAVYKVVNRSSIHNIKAPKHFNWASIYQISWYGIQQAAVGQSILFSGQAVICSLQYAHHQYPIIPEGAILATEI